MSRANGQTSEVVASFLFEEVLTDPEKAAIQDLIGVSPAEDVEKRIIYDPVIGNVTATDATSLRSVATVDLPANTVHAINLGTSLEFYRLVIGVPSGPSPEQVIPLDYDVSENAKHWVLYVVSQIPLVLDAPPENELPEGSLIVTGSLTTPSSGLISLPPFLPYQLVNGKMSYTDTGSASAYGIVWIASKWQIIPPDASGGWESSDNVATPDLVTTWSATGGATGTPAVDLAGEGTAADYLGQDAIFGERVWKCVSMDLFTWVETTDGVLVMDTAPVSEGVTMTVSGTLTTDGSTPAVFPTLVERDALTNGKRAFADVATGIYVAGVFWSGSVWNLSIDSGAGEWESSDDVVTPDLVTTWTPQGAATGTPTLTPSAGTPADRLGQDAIVNEEEFYKCVRLDPVKWVGPFPS